MLSLKSIMRLRYLNSPLRIPEARLGKFYIVHEVIPPNTCFGVVNARRMIYGGENEIVKIIRDKPTIIHKLKRYGNILMTDCPLELRDMAEAVHKASGHVLIGGLGLGCVVAQILNRSKADQVTVVEKEQDVVGLVYPYLKPQPQAIVADLFQFLKTIRYYPFNFSYFDIYYGTGEGEWLEYVMPLRRIVANRFGAKHIVCWQEEVMEGQLRQNFNRSVSLQEEFSVHFAPQWVFKRSVLDTSEFGITELGPPSGMNDACKSSEFTIALVQAEQKNMQNTKLQQHMKIFFREVGTPKWERMFGRLFDSHSSYKKKYYEDHGKGGRNFEKDKSGIGQKAKTM